MKLSTSYVRNLAFATIVSSMFFSTSSVYGVKEIYFRNFSPSPTLDGSTSICTSNEQVKCKKDEMNCCLSPLTPDGQPNVNYGALNFFLNEVANKTKSIKNDGSKQVLFIRNGSFSVTAPCQIINHIGEKTAGTTATSCPAKSASGHVFTAAFDAGSQLNPQFWGFLFNSVPFGLTNFDDWVHFLFHAKVGPDKVNGLTLVQSILDDRGYNVQVFPVLGSPPQSSGYLKADASDIGLEAVCNAGSEWLKWRYLPPAQNILQLACQPFGGLQNTATDFQPAGGGVSVLGLVQNRTVQSFEFSSVQDNTAGPEVQGFFPTLPPVPVSGPRTAVCSSNTSNNPNNCWQNPGHAGLRYIHYPAWHQPFFTGFMIINKDVWNSLDKQQQKAIEKAAKASLKKSFDESNAVECQLLQRVLDYNNNELQYDATGNKASPPVSARMQLATWKPEDLEVLQEATATYINNVHASITDPDILSDFDTIFDAYAEYLDQKNFVWEDPGFPGKCKKKDCPSCIN